MSIRRSVPSLLHTAGPQEHRKGCTGMKMDRHRLLVNARNTIKLGVELEDRTYKLTTEVGSLGIEVFRELQHS